jgi:TolB-like protein
MAADSSSNFELEIAHVLFMDVVGYSKLLVDEQRGLLNELNEVVRSTDQFRNAEAAGKLIRLPTGDGMALAFFTNPEAPVKCALEISKALTSHPRIRLRMGIHSGPVSAVTDVNDRSNVAGAGINMAQRVMDCGDAGHILLSQRIAEDLAQYTQWQPMLHDLGECEVKHGIKLHLVNLYSDQFGNSQLAEKLKKAQEEQAAAAAAHRPPATVRRRNVLLGAAILLAATGALIIYIWRPSPSGNEIPQKSIAVLPFENFSADKENAFFADGIQDDILTSLGKIKELTVIARASVMAYRGATLAGKVREIGQTLGVSHVLEGSVRRSATLAVINVRLIDTHSEREVWSQRYERGLTDMLSLQGEVAVEIARELQATLTPNEATVVRTTPTENPEAYLLYLRAREMELRFMPSAADSEASVRLYQQAVDLDPAFALARARLSMCLVLTAGESGGDPSRMARTLAEANEALRLQPGLGEGRLALAYYYFNASDLDRALAELAQAEVLLPNSAEVWRIRGSIYRYQNKIRERIAALRRAETLDPRDKNSLRVLAGTLREVRDWPEAIRVRDRLQAVFPDEPLSAKYTRAFEEFRLTGKIDPLKQVIAEPPGRAGGAPEKRMFWQFELAMLERDFVTAERLLHELPAKEFEDNTHPKAMEEALLAVGRGGDRVGIERTLIAARQKIEELRAASPNEYNSYINLGLIDAFLGRKDQAVREGQRAVELAARSSLLEKNDASAALALIDAWIGASDQAMELIEHLLTVPANLYVVTIYNMTVAELKWRWEWDPLRDDPRFRKILARPEPKTVY